MHKYFVNVQRRSQSYKILRGGFNLLNRTHNNVI